MEQDREKEDKPFKPVENRREDGTFGPGNNANPAGRPKGKTMKEYARQWLMNMSEEEKKEWLKKQSPETIWRMAEGNPHQTTEQETTLILPRPLDDVYKDESIQEDKRIEETN